MNKPGMATQHCHPTTLFELSLGNKVTKCDHLKIKTKTDADVAQCKGSGVDSQHHQVGQQTKPHLHLKGHFR